MQIAATFQSYPINRLVQEQSKSGQVPTTTQAEQPALVDANQQTARPEAADQSQYEAGIEVLAALLSTQGAGIMPPDVMLALQAPQRSGASIEQSTSTASGAAESTPITASEVAGEMVTSLGSDGVLTLTDVESAENGSMSANAATSLDANSYNDIAEDFNALSGGADVMTASQLISAVQRYIDTQEQNPAGFASRIISVPA